MSTLTIPNTFAPGEVIDADEQNANFTAVKNFAEGVSAGTLIDSNAITSDKILANAITTAKITDANVTLAKLASADVPIAPLSMFVPAESASAKFLIAVKLSFCSEESITSPGLNVLGIVNVDMFSP